MGADLPSLISEGRRLIEEATKDGVLPLKRVVANGYRTLAEADGTPLARADEDGCGFVEDCAVDVVFFALDNLPLLLAVAEAAGSLDFDGGLCGMDEPEYHYEFTKAEVERLRAALRGEVK